MSNNRPAFIDTDVAEFDSSSIRSANANANAASGLNGNVGSSFPNRSINAETASLTMPAASPGPKWPDCNADAQAP